MAGVEDLYRRHREDEAYQQGASAAAAGAAAAASRGAPWSLRGQQHEYGESPLPHFHHYGLHRLPSGPPGSGSISATGAPLAPGKSVSSIEAPGASGNNYTGLGFGLVGLASDYLASHPFVVLRRQCQVNHAAMRRHRTPFTLLPVIVSLQRTQGLSCLWKVRLTERQ